MDPMKMNWKVIGVVFGAILLVWVGVACLLVGRWTAPDPVAKARREWAERAARQVDPGFRLSRGVFPPSRIPTVDQVYWRITNERNDPLVVKGVTYNGEYTAELRGLPTPSFPVRLTVGESCEVLERWCWQREGYLKEIVYIDVHTNRGRFRYRPGRGFE